MCEYIHTWTTSYYVFPFTYDLLSLLSKILVNLLNLALLVEGKMRLEADKQKGEKWYNEKEKQS